MIDGFNLRGFTRAQKPVVGPAKVNHGGESASSRSSTEMRHEEEPPACPGPDVGRRAPAAAHTHAPKQPDAPDAGPSWSRNQRCPTMGAVRAAAYLQLGPLHLPLRPLHLEAGPLVPEEVEDPGDVVLSPGRLCSSLRSPQVPPAAAEEDPGGRLLVHGRTEAAWFRLGPLLWPLQEEMLRGSPGSIHSRLGWTAQVLLEEDGGRSKAQLQHEDRGSTSAWGFQNKTTSFKTFGSDLSSIREQHDLL